MDLLAGLVGNITGRSNRITDAAAVHHGKVHIHIHIVEQVIKRVRAEVTRVGLLLTHEAGRAVFRIVLHRISKGADLDAELLIDLGDPLILDRLDIGIGGNIGQILSLEKLGGDLAVLGDGHLTERCKIGAGLSQNDGLAVLVLDFLHFNGAVRVAVNKRAQAADVRDHVLGVPGIGRRIVAEVAESDDIVCLLGSRINGLLNSLIERLAVRAAGDTVNVLALLILEVGRRGLGEGFRRGDANKGDLHAADLENLVRVEDQIASNTVFFMIEIAGNIGDLALGHRFERTGHAIVEFVVADGRQIVTGGLHQLNDRSPLIHGTVSGTLDVVTGVDQQDILEAVLIGRDRGILDILGHVGMDIVTVKHCNVARRGLGSRSRGRVRRLLRRKAGHGKRKYHSQCEQDG